MTTECAECLFQKAINETVEEAFPGYDLNQKYALTLAFQINVLLQALSPADRGPCVRMMNAMLAKLNPECGSYRLVASDADVQ